MTGGICPCCAGTGIVDVAVRPLCATAVQQRDRRSPGQLRRMAALQRVALRGVAYDGDGVLMPPHGDTYVEYVTSEQVA